MFAFFFANWRELLKVAQMSTTTASNNAPTKKTRPPKSILKKPKAPQQAAVPEQVKIKLQQAKITQAWKSMIEEAVHKVCMTLIDNKSVSEKYFAFVSKLLSDENMADVIMERNLSKKCGSPFCENSIPSTEQVQAEFAKSKQGRYRVDEYSTKIYDNLSNLYNRYCCDDCLVKASLARKDLPTDPVYLRQNSEKLLHKIFPKMPAGKIQKLRREFEQVMGINVPSATIQLKVQEREPSKMPAKFTYDGSNTIEGYAPKHIPSVAIVPSTATLQATVKERNSDDTQSIAVEQINDNTETAEPIDPKMQEYMDNNEAMCTVFSLSTFIDDDDDDETDAQILQREAHKIQVSMYAALNSAVLSWVSNNTVVYFSNQDSTDDTMEDGSNSIVQQDSGLQQDSDMSDEEFKIYEQLYAMQNIAIEKPKETHTQKPEPTRKQKKQIVHAEPISHDKTSLQRMSTTIENVFKLYELLLLTNILQNAITESRNENEQSSTTVIVHG